MQSSSMAATFQIGNDLVRTAIYRINEAGVENMDQEVVKLLKKIIDVEGVEAQVT